MIVNVTSQNLDLQRGTASKALLDKGGKEIQAYLKENYKSGIKGGDIAISVPGKLNCQEIYHITLQKKETEREKVNLIVVA